VIAFEETVNSSAIADCGYIRELDATAAVDEAMRFDTAVRRVISVDDGSCSAVVVVCWRSPTIKILINFIVDIIRAKSTDINARNDSMIKAMMSLSREKCAGKKTGKLESGAHCSCC